MPYLISEVERKLQIDLGDVGGIYLKSEYVVDWVNEAIREIFKTTQIGRESEITINLAVGEWQWTPPSPLNRVHWIRNDDSIPQLLEERTYANLIESYGVNFVEREGYPPLYYWRGYDNGVITVHFAPKVSKIVNLRASVSYMPDEFTDNTGDISTLLPPQYNDDVLTFCKMKALEREKEYRGSEIMERKWVASQNQRLEDATDVDENAPLLEYDVYDWF